MKNVRAMKFWDYGFPNTSGLARVLGLCVLIGGGPVAQGATILVRKDGSGNYTTIQAAVNAMAARDTCLVGPGVYLERISFPTGKSGNATGYTIVKAETKGTVDTWGFDTRNCNYLRIEGFNITVPTNLTGAGIALRSSNLQVVSNYIHDVRAEGMSGGGNSITNVHLLGNHIYHVGRGLLITGTNWLVEANEIERIYFSGAIDDTDNIIFFGAYHVIRSNWFHGTLESEIGPAHVDGFQSWDHNGEFIQHIRIEANRLEGFYHQGVIMQAGFHTNSFDIVICNNQFLGAMSFGVLAFQSVRDVRVNHNLFKDIDSIGVGIDSGSTGEVRNNIFYNVCCWDDGTPRNIGSKNIWYRPGVTTPARFDGDLLNVNPQFVDVTNGNFHLRANSPAIDAGLVVTNVPFDLEGVPRPQGGGWDIGIYEYKITIPQLLTPLKSNGNFVFTLSGEIGSSYSLQASTNLQNWSALTSVTLSNTTALVSRPVTGGKQFYRVLLLP